MGKNLFQIRENIMFAIRLIRPIERMLGEHFIYMLLGLKVSTNLTDLN